MNLTLISTLFCCFCMEAFAQAPTAITKDMRKGDFYFYWGWNRGFYTNSDIHFTGDNYDFELKDVVGTDIQSEFGADPYLNPGRLTIPQTNFRLGYFINEHYNISLGFDHMKYVVQQNQVVKINGEIDGTGTIYDRTYADDDIELTKDFLQLEHTDGLNYINVGFNRVDDILVFDKVNFSVTEGVAIAALIPRTDAELLNFGDNDYYHLSGFGLNAMVGLNITFFNTFFVQSELKGGYINMPSVRTTNDSADKASQSFWFGQYNIVFGGVVNIGAWSKNKSKTPSE